MNSYDFKIISEQDVFSDFCGTGSNAIEAFEDCIGYGVYVPHGSEFTVVARNMNNGIKIRFQAFID